MSGSGSGHSALQEPAGWLAAVAVLACAAVAVCFLTDPKEKADDSKIRYLDQWYSRSDLSAETIAWLEWYNGLSAEEQLAVSSVPHDLYDQAGYGGRADVAVETVDAEHMGIAGTISGCGPAFAAMFIEALSDGAVLHGLSRELSYKLASQMVAGTAGLQLATGRHPGAMKDGVCSPGGTTIRGVAALERNGFRNAVISAIDAVERRQ